MLSNECGSGEEEKEKEEERMFGGYQYSSPSFRNELLG